MSNGIIIEAARKQNRSLTFTSATIVVLCLGILAYNWRYLFNFAAGPVPFSAALAAAPGAREFVVVKGDLVPTGVAQQTVIKLKHRIPISSAVTAEYKMVRVEGRLLAVKVSPEFSGNTVVGRLEALPADLAKTLEAEGNFYPWLVSATTGYRWDFSLLLIGAVVIFPFAALSLGLCLWRGADVTRNPGIKNLQRFGQPELVVEAIEGEMSNAGQPGRIGPLALTASWVVIFEPLLKILAASEIVAIGRESKLKKSGGKELLKQFILIWSRGQAVPEEVEVAEPYVAPVIQRVAAAYPWSVVENVEDFRRRWAAERSRCEQEADSRRGARVNA